MVMEDLRSYSERVLVMSDFMTYWQKVSDVWLHKIWTKKSVSQTSLHTFCASLQCLQNISTHSVCLSSGLPNISTHVLSLPNVSQTSPHTLYVSPQSLPNISIPMCLPNISTHLVCLSPVSPKYHHTLCVSQTSPHACKSLQYLPTSSVSQISLHTMFLPNIASHLYISLVSSNLQCLPSISTHNVSPKHHLTPVHLSSVFQSPLSPKNLNRLCFSSVSQISQHTF